MLHAATDSASIPLMLVRSVPAPSSPNLSDQYKAIRRNVVATVLETAGMLFALSKALIAISAAQYVAYRMFERWKIR